MIVGVHELRVYDFYDFLARLGTSPLSLNLCDRKETQTKVYLEKIMSKYCHFK